MPFSQPFGTADQFNNAAPVAGIGDILQRQAGDAFGMYAFRINMLAIAKGSQNADLAAGVMAFNIGRRVFFCISKLLRQFERLVKGHVFVDHFGQNKVGRSVENPCDLFNAVGGQTQVQRLNDRDAAANTGFKKEVDVVFFSSCQKLGSLCRNPALYLR